MVALIVLLLILLIFGGLGLVEHVLWWILIIALVIWAIGFLSRVGSGRWYNW